MQAKSRVFLVYMQLYQITSKALQLEKDQINIDGNEYQIRIRKMQNIDFFHLKGGSPHYFSLFRTGSNWGKNTDS